MSAATASSWHDANQHYLSAALAGTRAVLERYIARGQNTTRVEASLSLAPPESLQKIAEMMSAPPALETLCLLFNLSSFERAVLLLSAGVELEATFAQLLAAAHGDARRTYPTFSVALAALPEAHWSAMLPAAPLRYWRLIEVGASETLTASPLRIDERVLHYLAGASHLDERLRGLVELVPPPEELPPSHTVLARRMSDCWSQAARAVTLPLVQLCGSEQTSKSAIAATACAMLRVHLYALRAFDVPAAVVEREAFLRLWEREAMLSGNALLVDCHDLEGAEGNSRAVLSLLERLRGMVIVSSREPLRLHQRLAFRLDVQKPTAAEQRSFWHHALGSLAQQWNDQVEAVVSQFHLNPQSIHAASLEVLTSLPVSSPEPPAPCSLWDSCRAQARPRLDDLAQRLEPSVSWDDLVLPEPQLQVLREVVLHVRHRTRVYETWGFAGKGARGLGISALFAGASGTGKTLAAEVLANELRLDLYRIDLSQVVSKYIGETERNLRRVFDAAEEGGAVLLFDEADALFGKRSEVKDSHDRYANIEISYLLQRMEAYRGLAILTTNLKSALDPAFLRRLRFVIQFPFPDVGQRAEIWRRIFPARTPTEDLDVAKLARLNVAGGNIHNIALNAAFLAADAGEPVRMSHLLRAARGEYAKLEKPLTETETGGWV
jgi:hypothetical protein